MQDRYPQRPKAMLKRWQASFLMMLEVLPDSSQSFGFVLTVKVPLRSRCHCFLAKGMSIAGGGIQMIDGSGQCLRGMLQIY
jgi:hypothetical protein